MDIVTVDAVTKMTDEKNIYIKVHIKGITFMIRFQTVRYTLITNHNAINVLNMNTKK